MLATIARLALTVRPLHFIKRIISVLTDGNDVVVVVSEDVLGVGRSLRAVLTPAATALSIITANSSGLDILKDLYVKNHVVSIKIQKTLGAWKCVNYTFNIELTFTFNIYI